MSAWGESKRASVTVIAVCQVAAMALWFSASAVVPALVAEHGLSKFAQAALTSGVQAGFVVGCLVSAIFGLAAQSRADEITRRLNFTDMLGQPKKFTVAQGDELRNLESEGDLYNNLAIGFFSAAGAVAITTTVLFIVDWKRGPTPPPARAFRFTPTFAKDGAGLAAAWSF